MKNSMIYGSLLGIAIALASCGNNAPNAGQAEDAAKAGDSAVEFTVAEGSLVEWTGKKRFNIGNSHTGTFTVKSGNLQFEKGDLKAGEFVIDMTSLKVLEKEPDEGLLKHLNGNDFFATDKFKEAKFVITKAEKMENNQYNVSGNLTLRDSTKLVPAFPVTITMDGDKVTAEGSTAINRLDWGVNFAKDGQSLTEEAVKAAKNGVVDKTVDIKIKLSAKKK